MIVRQLLTAWLRTSGQAVTRPLLDNLFGMYHHQGGIRHISGQPFMRLKHAVRQPNLLNGNGQGVITNVDMVEYRDVDILE